MMKTVTVNLAGQVFHIDENAFEKLNAYLQAIKRMYSAEEGGDEILSDIEARIAEILIPRLKTSGKEVVTLTDVEHIITLLGKPEELESDAEEIASSTKTNSTGNQKAEKRLYRNPDDEIIAGVSSGIAAYFNISDPLWIRLAFVLLVLMGFGSGILLYIILWIITPEAYTSTQKLQMRGEPVNLENLEKTFKKGVDNLENTLTNVSKNDSIKNPIRWFGKVIKGIINFVFTFIKAIVLLVIGIIVFAVIISLLATGVAGVASLPLAGSFIFESPSMAIITGIGAALLILITVLFFILLPLQLFSRNNRPFRKEVTVTMLTLWIAGMMLTAWGGWSTARHFKEEGSISQKTAMEEIAAIDTLIIQTSSISSEEPKSVKINIGWKKYDIEETGITSGRVRLNIESSPDSNIYVVEKYSARGQNEKSAAENAHNIAYNYRLEENHLILDDHVSKKIGETKWRNQKAEITILIPEGKKVIFSNITHILDEKPSIRSTEEYSTFENRVWTMESGYLVP